jgi:hypothetical protein
LAFISGPVPASFEREVTASPAEFERDLRKAWAGQVERVTDQVFRLRDGNLRLDVAVQAIGVRRLGLFELPRLAVSYRFEGGDESARHRMLTVLDRAMQRGGG